MFLKFLKDGWLESCEGFRVAWGHFCKVKDVENEKNKKKKSFNAILISVFTDKMVGLKTVIEHKLDNCPYFVT